jgi:putative ABC transport system substrate-binding protein
MRKSFVSWVTAALLLAAALAHAQQAANVPRIGFLSGSSGYAVANLYMTFLQGLHDLGYLEGKNIIIESRYANGSRDRLAALAAQLVNLRLDLIVAAGPEPTRAAKRSTATIPIVMAFDDDPVDSGVIASLAHPGGNITGLSSLAPEISGKQIELLKEIVPKLSRVAVLGTSTRTATANDLKEMEPAAGALGVQLEYLDVLAPNDIETMFGNAHKKHADALMVLASRVMSFQRKDIAQLAVKNRLPVIYYRREFVEDGGLMSYGASYTDLTRRAAYYIDKILKGAKPADLPVEQPTKFELVINLKAAKQIGLTIPPNVLARADRVIK